MTAIMYMVFLFFIFIFFPSPAVLKARDTSKNADAPASVTGTIYRNGYRLIHPGNYNLARKKYLEIKRLNHINYSTAPAMFTTTEIYRLEKNYVAAGPP